MSEEDRINIALRYERRVDELKETKISKDRAEHDDLFRLYGELKRMNKLKYKYEYIDEHTMILLIYNKGYPRAGVIKRFANKGTPIGEADHELDAIIDEIRWIKDNELKGRRILRFGGPQNFRKRLFKEISEEFTSLLGVDISPSYVKACVDQLRREAKGQGDGGTDDQT